MKKAVLKVNVCALPISAFALLLTLGAAPAADMAATNTPSAIPWNQIGARAGADYQGDGLAVTPTASGARLRCVFQRLEGEATSEGLWLTSTVTKTAKDRFRVTAMEVGRKAAYAPFISLHPESSIPLAGAGDVSVCGRTVRFSRPGLTEEYSVSMDGVRQDFVVMEKPPGDGLLKVQLAVSGAQMEAATYGAQLVLDKSRRKIAYSRLHATDANGKELSARIEVEPNSENIAVLVVDDGAAVYPVRIDPTFSDANWISMGGLDGTDGEVLAEVMDSSGNLYIGGQFAVVNNIIASNIAQWNGSSWLQMGSGINGEGACAPPFQDENKGSADGPGNVARFNFPYGVAVDSADNIYVGDDLNCTIRYGVQQAISTPQSPTGICPSTNKLIGYYIEQIQNAQSLPPSKQKALSPSLPQLEDILLGLNLTAQANNCSSAKGPVKGPGLEGN